MLIVCGAGLGLFQGPSILFYSTPSEIKSYCTCCLCLCLCQSLLLPAFPFLWVGLGKYLKTFHWGSQCDGALWLPLTGLSWLPSRSLVAPSVYSGAFPTPIYCRVLILSKCKNWGMKPFIIIIACTLWWFQCATHHEMLLNSAYY